jgi:hypothetical protein
VAGHPPAQQTRSPNSISRWIPWESARGPVQGDVLAAAHTHPKLQAVEPIEPAHPLAIDHPPLAAPQHPKPQVPEPRPRVRELANAQPQRGLLAGATAAIPRRATELREPTGTRVADLERHLEPPGDLPTARGPQMFFRSASDNICLSRVRSATTVSDGDSPPRAAAGGAARSRPGARTSSSTRRTSLR